MKIPSEHIEGRSETKGDTLAIRQFRLQRDRLKSKKIKSRRFSTAQLTLFASLLSFASALAGGAITGWFTNRTEEVKGDTSINLEKVKFETGLVIKAISTDDQVKAIRTLKFFASAGLIPTFERRISSLTENDNGAAIPVLESTVASPGQLPWSAENSKISRYIGYISQSGLAECNVTFFDRKHFIVPTHCMEKPYKTANLAVNVGQLMPQLHSIRAIGNMSDQISIPVLKLSAISDHVTLGTLAKENSLLLDLPQFRSPERSESVRIVYVDLQGFFKFSYMMLQEKCSVLEVNSSVATGALKGDFAYRCDTPLGTSGSPIISVTDGSVIGLVEGSGGGVDLGAPIPIEAIKLAVSKETAP